MHMLKLKQSNTKSIPVLPIRNVVVFPYTELVLTIGRQSSMLAINSAIEHNREIAIFTQISPDIQQPTDKDIYSVGTLCSVEKSFKSDNELNILIKGISRINLKSIISKEPFLLGNVSFLSESVKETEELQALINLVGSQLKKAINLGKTIEFTQFMQLMAETKPNEFADRVASTLNIEITKKQQLLEELDVLERLYKINEYLVKELKVLEIEKSIASKTQEKFSKSMREAILRERMQTIKKELGEMDETQQEITCLTHHI